MTINTKSQNIGRKVLALLVALSGVILFFSSENRVTQSELAVSVGNINSYPILETHNYYFIILVATVIWPIIASFIPLMGFSKNWKYLLLPILLWSIPFIMWDHFFTKWGVWGFNYDYISGIRFIDLPIEEILFFIVIPAACILLYHSVEKFIKPSDSIISDIIHILFILFLFVFGFVYRDYIYSRWASSIAIIVFSIFFLLANSSLLKFFLTFFITIIPMFIINGALTGMFTEQPVVLYNPYEFSNIRIGTMPIEDIIYQYSLLGGFVLLIEFQRK